ncbi:MAG: phospholipase A [Acidobacteriota bacterium]
MNHKPLVLAAALAVFLAVSLSAAAADSADTAKPEGKKPKGSYFTELWHLDTVTREGRPWVTFHRTNYALAFSYNASPNPAPLREVDPTKTLTKPEVTLQLSFKAKLWQDMFGKPVDLWVAYTQRSFWQLYHFEDSSPFRETDYEPEVLFNVRTGFGLLGWKGRFVQFGLNHQSNGQTEPLSKSWNRLVANVGLERGHFSVLVKGWYRLPENAVDDDNPRIEHYMGNGEIWGYYFLKRHRLAVMLRDNLNFHENRGAVQLEWVFPLFADVGGYVQYYLGYGESLLDYNHRVHRIGVGFVFMEWD